MSFFNAYFDTSCQLLLFSGLHLFYWKYIGTLKARNIQNPKLGRKYTPSFIVFLSCSREINSWATGEFNANFQEKRKKERDNVSMDIITKKSIWWMMSSIHGVLQQSKLLFKQPYRSNMMNNMFDEDRNSKQHKTDHCNSPSRRFRQTTIFKFFSHGSKALFCWCSALKIPPKNSELQH